MSGLVTRRPGVCDACDLPTLAMPVFADRDGDGVRAVVCTDCAADHPDRLVDPGDAEAARGVLAVLWRQVGRYQRPDVDRQRAWLHKRILRVAESDDTQALATALGAVLLTLGAAREQGRASVTSRQVLDAIHRRLS